MTTDPDSARRSDRPAWAAVVGVVMEEWRDPAAALGGLVIVAGRLRSIHQSLASGGG